MAVLGSSAFSGARGRRSAEAPAVEPPSFLSLCLSLSLSSSSTAEDAREPLVPEVRFSDEIFCSRCRHSVFWQQAFCCRRAL